MNGVDPFVRHMLLCDDVRRDPGNPNKVDIVGLIGTIQAAGDSPFPLHLPALCVYLELTGGRGTGASHIEVRHADSGLVAISTPTHTLTFPPNPLTVRGVIFRILDCIFPAPGLYWVQFWYNQSMLIEQPLVVR